MCECVELCISVRDCAATDLCVIVWRQLQTRLLLPRCRNVAADRRRADAAQTDTHTHTEQPARHQTSAPLVVIFFLFFPSLFEEITAGGEGLWQEGELCS